ncbi:MAG TPA: HNH endonuclease [Panacibacter sp.]|nr:HNH endonuclease [Panacibacter sp.]
MSPGEIKKEFQKYLEYYNETNGTPSMKTIKTYLRNLDGKVSNWAKQLGIVNETVYEKYLPKDVKALKADLLKNVDLKMNNNSYHAPLTWYENFCILEEEDLIGINIENISAEIVEKFQPQDEELLFPEGKAKYALHLYKERNKKLVALKKKLAFDKNPLLPCEICFSSFKEKYGDIGEGFIEAHHVFPISELKEGTETKLEDLILVCPNCHKMIHRKRPWLTIEQMKNFLVI